MRHFASLGDVEMLIVISFAKNMGLYGERVGALLAVCGDAPTAAALGSHVRCLIRAIYSSPPAHGARLVAAVLGDAARAAKWRAELATMAGRMHEMREALHAALVAEECPPPDGIAHALEDERLALLGAVGADGDRELRRVRVGDVAVAQPEDRVLGAREAFKEVSGRLPAHAPALRVRIFVGGERARTERCSLRVRHPCV